MHGVKTPHGKWFKFKTELRRSNLYTDKAIGWTMAEDSVLDFRQRKRYLASLEVQTIPGAHPSPYSLESGGSSSGVKSLKREANHSFPSKGICCKARPEMDRHEQTWLCLTNFHLPHHIQRGSTQYLADLTRSMTCRLHHAVVNLASQVHMKRNTRYLGHWLR
jgi:hypothetical protein